MEPWLFLKRYKFSSKTEELFVKKLHAPGHQIYPKVVRANDASEAVAQRCFL